MVRHSDQTILNSANGGVVYAIDLQRTTGAIVIRPETDISLLNRIANDASVRPFIRPDGAEMDFAPIEGLRIGEIGGVVLSNGQDAVGVFEMTGPCMYHAHTLFGPTCRGRKAINVAREMIDWIFSHNGLLVWGATPRENRAACLFNRLVGAKEVGSDSTHVVFEFRKAW